MLRNQAASAISLALPNSYLYKSNGIRGQKEYGHPKGLSGMMVVRIPMIKPCPKKWRCRAFAFPPGGSRAGNLRYYDKTLASQKLYIIRELSDKLETGELSVDAIQTVPSVRGNGDQMVDRLSTQLGVVQPIQSTLVNQKIASMFVVFFLIGVVFDKLWMARKRNSESREPMLGMLPQVPIGFSLFLENDLKRKESVEWVNMVLGKLWKVYRAGIENWMIGSLQLVIDDNVMNPDYVQRVEIKQFSLGEEPLSVRSVERRTSRCANDLQYQIGLRYTGGARMLLNLTLKFGFIPIVVPVGVQDFDIDGELWIQLQLIPSEPWIGTLSWAFVSLPKIKIVLSPFRFFNLMAIPVLSMFLRKLLTEDLPQLFVRPKKIVLDFQKGMAVGPASTANDVSASSTQEEKKDFVGELSVTLVDARKLAYVFFAKTDPYVVLSLGDQVVRSKRNSQTTVTAPPGEPIWNQDFHLLVENPKKQRLSIHVKDSWGFTDFTIGSGEFELGSLEDTVPTDVTVVVQEGWGLLGKDSCGELLLRLTYKAYVEDEEDQTLLGSLRRRFSDDENSYTADAGDIHEQNEKGLFMETKKESFMDVLAAFLVSEEFQGLIESETENTVLSEAIKRQEEPIALGPSNHNADLNSSSEIPGGEIMLGSALFWFAIITSVAIVISIYLGTPGLFNL